MELESLLTLIEKVSASNLDTFDYDDGSMKLTMKKKKKEVVVAAAPAAEPTGLQRQKRRKTKLPASLAPARPFPRRRPLPESPKRG